MYNLPVFGCQKAHFIGIGGVSMSGLAQILASDGVTVSGSDRDDSPAVQKLISQNIKVSVGHSAQNIHDQDLVVFSAAIGEENPEIVRAKELGIRVIERAELLGEIMKNYRCPIAVAGTHGKTTTTGMLSEIFLNAGTDPTITIGGEAYSINSNIRIGGKAFLIAEACEYHRSFLKFFPKISLILNIDADHLDYYKDIDDIRSAFSDFARVTAEDGAVVANLDDKNVVLALKNFEGKVLSFGLGKGLVFSAASLEQNDSGAYAFDVLKLGQKINSVSLCVPGLHNVYNALAAYAAADFAGISGGDIVRALGAFCGTRRRFEKKGELNGAAVIDDYAHHPAEIAATLKTARSACPGRVLCVFQPHTYTRTKTLFDDFVSVFNASGAQIILTDIYAAREADTGLVHAKDLAEKIKGAVYARTFDEAAALLREKARPGDLIITMGAGNIFQVGELFLQ